MDKVKNAADLEDRKWQNLWGPGYRFQEKQHARMADAFQSVEVYQCPAFPPTTFDEGARLTTSEMDYVTNAMPNPFRDDNIRKSSPQDLDTALVEGAYGIPSGTVYYWDRRKRGSLKSPSDHIYFAEVDESIVKQDLQGAEQGKKGTDARQSFIFNAIFVGAHLPYARGARMDNDIDEDGAQKRHPAGTTLFFFDGHGEAMSYRKIDPGPSKPAAVRLRYFSDVSKLGKRWQ
jgi:hypothetical protein